MENRAESSIKSSQEVLRFILFKRMKKNASYSARAFARDIGVSPAFVTMMMNGKKKISLNRAIEITNALKLGEDDKQSLMGAVLRENGMDLKFHQKIDSSALVDLSEEQFSVVADWYHFAILDLTTTKGFKSNIQWISKRLGLRPLETEMALNRLVKVGLLENRNGEFKKVNRQLDLPTKSSLSAVREHHRQMMEKAQDQLEKIDQKSFQTRMICSGTFAADSRKIEKARERVLEFQQELSHFLSDSEDCDEVFQLNIQLFPHTKDVT